MIARISSSLHARLLALAAAEPEREVCGLLLGAGTDLRITALHPAANVAPDPATRFEIDPAALFAVLRGERAGGPALLGHYHSHPRGAAVPSPCDAALAHDPGRLWLICGGGAVTAWQAVPGGSVHDAFEPVVLLVAPEGCETGQGSPQGA